MLRTFFVYLNQTVGGLLNPMSVALALLALTVFFVWRRRRRAALGFGVAALVWLYCWSSFCFPDVECHLERMYPPQRAEEYPQADAIVLLGGGIACNTNRLVYAELCPASDRVWHAARLYRAGKAPVIITSGQSEADASVPFLLDLGVPREAILVEPDARNTEENAVLAVRVLSARAPADPSAAARGAILLVTSAQHMRRACLMFSRELARCGSAIRVIPAACDYDGTLADRPFRYSDIFPSPDLSKRAAAFKEIIGYWGYRLFRR